MDEALIKRVPPHDSDAERSVIGAMIMEAIVCRTAELMEESGTPAEIFASANTEHGDEANEGYIRKYKPLVKSL